MENQNHNMSYYEYFKNLKTKAVAVISDKQLVFVYQDLSNFRDIGPNHTQIISQITEKLGLTKNSGFNYNANNVHFLCQDGDCTLTLPNSNKITISQFQFIQKLMNEFNRANSENASNPSKKRIVLFTDTDFIEDPNLIIKDLRKRIEKQIISEDEIIIGEVHDKDTIMRNMAFNLDFKSAKTNKELVDKIKSAKTYYDDSYYHNYFMELFPNFEKINEFADFLCNNNIREIPAESIDIAGLENYFRNNLTGLRYDKLDDERIL